MGPEHLAVTPRWMTPQEAADYARVKEGMIQKWIREGLLRPAITRNKQNLQGRGSAGYVIDSRDIDKIMERLKSDVCTGGCEPNPTSRPKRGSRLR